MIVRMMRVRIAGPRAKLDRTLATLQDLGVVQIDRPAIEQTALPDRTMLRRETHVRRCLVDVETALERLQIASSQVPGSPSPELTPHTLRHARRVRRAADSLAARESALDDERTLLLRYREFFKLFGALAGHELTWPDGQAFYLILRARAGDVIGDLENSLSATLDGEITLVPRRLSSGEWVVLLLASARVAPKVSSLLAAARIEELPAPAGLGEKNTLRALPALNQRLADITLSLDGVRKERQSLAVAERSWLCMLRAFLHDQLLQLDARARVCALHYLFVIEGWIPAARVGDVDVRLHSAVGPDVVVSTMRAEDWSADRAPVTLNNPALFRPFEMLTRMVPLPKYGTIDPTPFVAIFFPAFFGLMLGDAGYGLMLAFLALVLRLHSTPESLLRSVSTVAFACASSTLAFGILFGELFGTLGRTIGLNVFFDREQATTSFLALALALGVVHIVVGLVLAALTAWRGGHRREAAGRGLTLAMVMLITLSLLAAFEVLPAELFTPFVIAVLVGFTVLVAFEGMVAVIELVSTLGHVLSYARIMALGTASLMLAIVANEMAGAIGSVLIGVVFALLFHLVNFALGLLSPTIHALRLHYVEFFGQFFSPGGAEYRPFGHWRPSQ